MMRSMLAAALVLLATPMASFAEDVGIPVTIRVLDIEGSPVTTAVVRHPDEKDPHRVNSENGEWTNSVLYMPNGDEFIFEKGTQLEFEVSAPGYQTSRINYEVRKRRNTATVVLQKMELSLEDEGDDEDIVIQFGRDKPRD